MDWFIFKKKQKICEIAYRNHENVVDTYKTKFLEIQCKWHWHKYYIKYIAPIWNAYFLFVNKIANKYGFEGCKGLYVYTTCLGISFVAPLADSCLDKMVCMVSIA